MIYIKRLNLVFIKIPKNASTSFSNFLIETLVTNEDIYTNTANHDFDLNNMTSQNIDATLAKQSHITYLEAVSNNLIPSAVNCYGIIRNPLERMLSLYIYRLQQKTYGNILPSTSHFQSLVKDGVFQDFYWQQTAQTAFLKGASNIQWLLYDNLASEVAAFTNKYAIAVSKFPTINRSVGDKTHLVTKYFTKDMIDCIRNCYIDDFNLYEELKFVRQT